jgi:hypothetical protein
MKNGNRNEEEKVVSELKRVASEKPETTKPSVVFKQDWAFGNAGLEDESITREQVEKAIKD